MNSDNRFLQESRDVLENFDFDSFLAEPPRLTDSEILDYFNSDPYHRELPSSQREEAFNDFAARLRRLEDRYRGLNYDSDNKNGGLDSEDDHMDLE